MIYFPNSGPSHHHFLSDSLSCFLSPLLYYHKNLKTYLRERNAVKTQMGSYQPFLQNLHCLPILDEIKYKVSSIS